MTETHQVGTAMVIVFFTLWLVSWVGLGVYGLVWLWRDRARALISIGLSAAVFAMGAISLLNFTPGSNL